MKQTQHIIRKDLRRVRWTFAAWCLLVFAKVLLETVGADVAFEGFGPQFAIAELSSAVTWIEVVLAALLISRLVHEEPLVSRDAFWITRPIEPGSLLAAKLALATLFLIALPAAGAIVVMARFGTRLPDILEAISASVLYRALWSSLLLAVAVVTPTLMRYALTLVGIVAAFAVAIGSVLVATLLMMSDESSGGGGVPDPTSGLIAILVVIAVALTVIIYQYRRRRLGRALLLAGAGIVAIVVVPWLWPWSLAKPAHAESSGADTATIGVALDATVPARIQDSLRLRRGASKQDITARVLLTAVPPGLDVHNVSARSTLTMSGATLTSDLDRGSAGFAISGALGGRRSIEAALGNLRLLSRPDPADERWVVLMRLDESDVARHAGQTGVLTSTLNVHLNRSMLAATMPLADGSVVETRSQRFQIVRVIRRATGCTVFLRVSYVEPLLAFPVNRQFTYLLQNRTRREAVMSYPSPVFGRQARVASLYTVSFATSVGTSGFVLDEYELQFPQRMPAEAPAPILDGAWLADAEFALVETVPAGSVRRTITVEGLRMPTQ